MDKLFTLISQTADVHIVGLSIGPAVQSLIGMLVLLTLVSAVYRRVRGLLPWGTARRWIARNVFSGSHPLTQQRLRQQSVMSPAAKVGIETMYCLSAGYLLEIYSIATFVFLALTYISKPMGLLVPVFAILAIFLVAGIALVDAGRRRLVVIHHRSPIGYGRLTRLTTALLLLALAGLLSAVIVAAL